MAAWSAFLLIVATMHTISAIRLDPVVEERLADGCFEWCGLDQVIHQVSAGFTALVVVAWTPILWAAARMTRSTRITGHVQWILTTPLLLVNLWFVQSGHWSFFLNAGTCTVALVLGGYSAWGSPAHRRS